ncbi:MAG: hypothetical protein ACYCZZ_02885 [Minisyncoccota bacterium]
MSLFGNLFRKKGISESVVVIDIGASSVAGAYVRYQEGEPVTMLYSRRLPIEIRKGEVHDRAMLRALGILGNDLIREGAPVLARAVGSGTVDVVLVSIDAPWQETEVRTEHFEEKDPFVFTKSLITKRLEEKNTTPSEKLLADESVIGTILNGYETRNPYGKKAHRAAVIILLSLIERQVAHDILVNLESLYHTRRVLPIAGSSLRYQAMRNLFPHERDAIILDATGRSLTSISLVRKGIFVNLTQVSTPSDDDAWVSSVHDHLAEMAERYPLPRTIFLLAREPEISSLREKLDAAHFGSLWLSDSPPKIVSVLKNQIIGSIRQMATNSPDTVLLLMTLYYQARDKGERL